MFDPRNRQEIPPREIEMLGKARRLLTGPDYRLMPGEWLTEVVIRISENPSRNHLMWQISEAEQKRGTLKCELPADGRLALTQKFTVENVNNPISFIFETTEGAIEGLFSVESIRLRRMAAAPLD